MVHCPLAVWLMLAPVTNVLIFLKPDTLATSNEIRQFKRLQNERGRTDHDVWLSLPNQQLGEAADDIDIVQRGLQMLGNEGSESNLKSRVLGLEDELQRVYGAYGDLKGLHEKLWRKYVDEKIQE
jgi:hypothetical protein